MPGQVRPVTDERDSLLSFLTQMRYQLTLTAHGLTTEQLRATPSASALSVGGLIKHCAFTEAGWIDTVLQRPPTYKGSHDWDQFFELGPDETLDDVTRFYEEVAEETERALAGITDLGQAVPINHDLPWNPKDYDNWSVRWVLLHLIQETARHTGHADIIRESIDKGTAYALMAAAEDWPDTDWLQKWKPADV
jgi:uncharacterized damage-inducible protein DinB